MRGTCFVPVFLLLCVFITEAQITLPDSLQRRYATVKKDSAFIDNLNELATAYLKNNPALSRRIASYTTALAPELKYTRGYARALTVLGNSYWYEGVYEFAQNYYMLAARQYQNIHDSVGLGKVYNNIGEVNKRFGEFEKSLDYLLQSINLRKGDSTIALTLYNIGELYIVAEQYEKAMQYIYKSLDMARHQRDERSITYCYWSMARIKSAEGNFKDALTYFKLAIARWKKSGEIRTLIETYHDIAGVYRKQNQLSIAKTYLDEAFALGQNIRVPDLRVKTYLEYARLDSTRGDYKSALKFLSLHNTLKDSVYNLLKAEQIARVQIIYETERNERENEQLKAERALKQQQLNSKEGLIAAISCGLILVLLLATVLFRQRSQILKVNQSLQEKNDKIHFQKEAIEAQAITMIKLNEELQQLNKTLENRIEERSQQLKLQNQKLAEYAFVNAHKLRAPVASIIGLIQLLNQELEQGERDVILNHLKTCSIQLDSVIQQISRNLASDTDE